jgi:uroporphyrinogen decarboxylase
MLPKERVLAAFEHREYDKVPVHHISFSSQVASAILGREAYVGGGIQQWREACALWQGADAHTEFIERSFQDALELALTLDQDIVRISYWRMAERPTRRIDEYTFMYGDPEGRWRVMRFDPDTELYQTIDFHPKTTTTMEDLERRIEAMERSLEGYKPTPDEFPFEMRAQQLIGHERAVRVGGAGIGIPREEIWLEAILLRPDLVARWLDIQAERAIRRIELLARLGFRYVWGGGDFASNQGPFYSPKVFRELILPRLIRVSQACHRHGLFHLFASDGNLWPVAEDLFGRSGVDGYYEIDRRAGMDLCELRRRFPHLTLLGNISSHTLHLGTRDEVIAETLSCIEESKRSGSIIVGCSNLIVPGTPPENVMAMIETIQRHRDLVLHPDP